MTPEQIENWRHVLYGLLGPYAGIMSEADIIAFRDKTQQVIENESTTPKKNRTGLCEHNVSAKYCRVCK